MTHLVPPYLTTIGKSKTKKLTPAQVKAKQEHDTWLKKQNLHPDQLSKKSRNEDSRLPDLRQRTPVALSNTFAPGGAKTGIMENLRNEKPHVQAEIMAKAKQVAIPYNKGPAMFCSKYDDPKYFGKK
jgi:hypothetical protein